MKEAILQAGDALIQLLDYQDDTVRKRIQKGLSLYRQGYVYNLKELQHYAGVVVHDEREWMVLLNLQDLSKSECDCGDSDFCPHRLAGFFYAYAASGRVGDLLEKWKQQSASLQMASSLAAFRPKKEMSINRTDHSYSLNEWQDLLEDRYGRFTQAKLVRSTSIYAELYEQYFLSLTKEAPSLSPYRELFMIHAGLLTFMKMCDVMSTQKLSKQTFNAFVRTPLSQLIYEIEQNVYKAAQTSMPFSADTLLYETMKQIRMVLFYTSALPYERIDLYRTLWTHLFKRPKWIKEEKQYLENVHGFQLERDVVFAHLLVLEKQDEKAVAFLKQADLSIFPYVFKWAKDHIYYKDEQRANIWLLYIKERMAPYIRTLPSYQGSRAFVSMLLSLFESYSELCRDKAVYTDALRSLLPYSFVEYSQYLYEQKQFQSWLELQAAFRYDILEYDRSILKDIEAKNPKWLLPIYHQSIQQSIEKKTRSSYEEAVQHLKELQRLYKNLQNEQVFTSYLQQLTQSTKRLRAFQEALKKGGFAHD
ncbi:hypothetical protein ACFOU2_24365 [Bacillus songklensis]|uniref:SWIM-type domain-containing protein n=1 Tax=Bacillus songklensis TaxID=1069116 RepID=A0ABV8BAW5_9BACI